MDAIVSARNISKMYNKKGAIPIKAVDAVSLDIGKGECVAIMGASGSGKTTLMNILSCLDRPTGGEIFFDGVEVSQMQDESLARLRNEKIGFVFQSFNLLPRTSALENVELPLIYSEKDNIKKLARNALERVGLGDRLNHYPGELSGGQQQRVAIARAIVNDPDIIFADEPTGNLDVRASYEVMALFQDLNRQGRTVVIVTHEHDIAHYTERIVRVEDGKIISDSRNTEVKEAVKDLNEL